MYDYYSNSHSIRTQTTRPTRRYGFENFDHDLQNEPPPPKSGIRDILTEFCTRGTIHGVNHIVEPKRHWIERAWWIIAITVSAIACFSSIYNVWSKWKAEPIIVAAETRPTSISRIPFPAVTICPFTAFAANKFNYTAAFRLLSKLDGNNTRQLTTVELKLLKLASQFCYEGYSSCAFKRYANEYFDDENDDLWNTINKIAPPFNETFVFCKLFGKEIDCEKLFVRRTTERGLCYTFNTLNAHEMYTNETPKKYKDETLDQPPSNWNLHFGYSKHTHEDYPYRTRNIDLQSSLTIVLKALKDDLDYICSGGTQGFTGSLHPPNEGPQMLKRFFYIPLKQTLLLSVNPIRVRTIRAARANDLSVRQCYLDAEHQLRFYRHYTTQNCRYECLTNYTLAQCGCVKISMPRSNGTKVCGPGKVKCFRNADGDSFRTDALPSCNCLETCTSIDYNLHVSQISHNFSQSHLRNELKFDNQNAMFSRLMVKFKSNRINVVRRIDAMTWNDFYSKLGGLFGLFLGASILSFVELLYYVTLRLFFNYREEHVPKYPYLP